MPLQSEEFLVSSRMQPPTEFREQQKLELAASILRSGGTLRIKALGASMLPTLWPGDLLVIENTPCHRITLGDIALVMRDGRIFAHRLIGSIGQEGHRWITRGDAMPQNDPPAPDSDVLGRVACIHRRNRVIVPSRQPSLLTRAVSWLLCYSTTSRNLALRVHLWWQEGAVSRATGIADILQRG
jgi:Peptidase S24-like